jgi:HD-GYP domain-containing protein (c-di-GMP phosphodiesterase class II)
MEASPQRDSKSDTSKKHRYRLSTEHVKLGMFVAELDRPWLDTPFLIEGVLLKSQEELSTIKRICYYVYIDLDKSISDVVQDILSGYRATLGHNTSTPHLNTLMRAKTIIREEPNASLAPSDPLEARRVARLRTNNKIQQAFDKASSNAERDVNGAEPNKTAKGRRRYQTRSDLAVSRETRGKFTGLVKSIAQDYSAHESLADRAVNWVRDLFGSKVDPLQEAARHKKARQEIRVDLAKTLGKQDADRLKFVTYQDRTSAIEEVPKARAVFSKSEETLGAFLGDIRNGRVPALDTVRESVNEMVDSMVNNPDALLWIARLREEHITTYDHGVKVGLYMVALGRHLGFPKTELSNLGLIGMLADVGKTRLPKALLEKPGLLSPAEYLIAKEHVRLGLDALKETSELSPEVELGISQHHERMDGSGYPKGLVGDQISVYGRMAAIADCFSALITPRPYANPQAPQEALMSLYEWGEKSLHLPLIEQFIQAVSVFPVGSMVELSSAEIAVVLAHNRARRLEPKVLVLTWPDKTPLATPVERDLMMQPRDISNIPIRIVRGLPAGAYGLKIRDYYGSEIAAANNLF